MSVSDADPLDGTVLVTTDQLPPAALSVREQLEDVSNPFTKDSSEPALKDPPSLTKPDASNGEISHDHVEPQPVADNTTLSDSNETAVQETGAPLEKADEAQGAPVQDVDNVVSDSVATDNVASTTVDGKREEDIFLKEADYAGGMPDVEAEAASEREELAVIAVAGTDTTDKSLNDSAIEIAPPALEQKEDDAKHDATPDDELGVEPAQAEKPTTGAVGAEEPNSTVNVEVTPEGTGHSQNGEVHVTHVNVEAKDVEHSANEENVPGEISGTEEEKEEEVQVEPNPVLIEGDVVAQAGAAEAVSAVPAADLEPSPSTEAQFGAPGAVPNAEQGESQVNPKDVVVEPEPTVLEERLQYTDAQAEIAIVAGVVEGGAVVVTAPVAVASETSAEVQEDACATTAEDGGKDGVDETPGEPASLAVTGEAEEDKIVHEAESAAAEGCKIDDDHEANVKPSVDVGGDSEGATEVEEATHHLHEENAAEGPGPAVCEATEEIVRPGEAIAEVADDEASAAVEAEPAIADEVTIVEAEVGVPEADAEVADDEASAAVETEPAIADEVAIVEAEVGVPEADAEVADDEASATVEAEPAIANEVTIVEAEVGVPEADAEATPEEAPPIKGEIFATSEEPTVSEGEVPSEATVPGEAEKVDEGKEVTPPEAGIGISNGEAAVPSAREGVPVSVAEADLIPNEAPGDGTSDEAPVESEHSVQVPVAITRVDVVAPEETAPAAEASHEEAPTAVEVELEGVSVPLETVPIALSEDVSTASELNQPNATEEMDPTSSDSQLEKSDVANVTPSHICQEEIQLEAPAVGEEATQAAPAERPASSETLNAAPEIADEAALPDEAEKAPEPDADIKDVTEVVLEDTSVVLATGANEETLSAVTPGSDGEVKIEEETLAEAEQPTNGVESSVDVSEPPVEATPAVEEVVTENAIGVGQSSEDVLEKPAFVEESTVAAAEAEQEVQVAEAIHAKEEFSDAPATETATSKAKIPGLNTEALFIETSLDATTYTPVLDSGIELKEQEPQPSQLLSIAEEVERPKSPWSPSFQVTTIGGSTSQTDEDVNEASMDDYAPASESVEVARTSELPSVPPPVADAPPTVAASEDLASVFFSSFAKTRSSAAGSFFAMSGFASAGLPSEGDHGFPGEASGPDTTVPVAGEAANAEETDQNELPEQGLAAVATGAEVVEESHVLPTEEVGLTNVVEQTIEVASIPTVEVSDEGANIQESNEQVEAMLTSDVALEPPARPWTPSYSVHSQGSPLAATKELDVVPIVGTATEPVAGQPADHAAEIHVEEATVIDTDNTQQDNVVQGGTISPCSTQEPTTMPITATENEKAEDSASKLPVSVQVETTTEDIVEPSSRPWASVHSQGNSPVELAGFNEAPVLDTESQPQPAQESKETVETEPVETTTTAPSEPLETASLQRPEESWTPSYSVHSQGSPTIAPKEVSEAPAEIADSEPQPNEAQEGVAESNALQPRPAYDVTGAEEKFVLFSLRALVAYLWVLPKWLSLTPSEHAQREPSSSSTSSSKLFPGGWFTPKPNENRTSLDVAQGEFAASPKATTSRDVFDTLSSDATVSTGAVNVAADGDDGQKRRWCVVM